MLKQYTTKIKLPLCLVMAMGLAACTSKAPETVITPNVPEKQEEIISPDVLWQQHQVKLRQISSFKVNGSMAYVSNKTKHYARFYLNQKSRTSYELKLTTPLGGTVMSLVVKPNFAELTDQHGEKYQGKNVELLLAELTGMNIPLKSLHNWLIGLSNNPAVDKIDANGYLKQTEFKQDDVVWAVKISAYNSKTTTVLPSQVELTHKDESIKLKMNTWTL